MPLTICIMQHNSNVYEGHWDSTVDHGELLRQCLTCGGSQLYFHLSVWSLRLIFDLTVPGTGAEQYFSRDPMNASVRKKNDKYAHCIIRVFTMAEAERGPHS